MKDLPGARTYPASISVQRPGGGRTRRIGPRKPRTAHPGRGGGQPAAPAPLERQLEIFSGENGLELRDGETVIAEASQTNLQHESELPAPVPINAAERASALFPFHTHHPRPSCVVCSPARIDGCASSPNRSRVPG
jgi:hypothetical protein